jgi:Zn-finger nucleic acid-binding protein
MLFNLKNRRSDMTNAAEGMPCPVCKVPLVMSERQGVEIDYCPQCRGVWLDRGELDKILERNARESAPAHAPQAPSPQPAYAEPHYAPQPHYGHGHQRPHHKRRKSFLEELFD